MSSSTPSRRPQVQRFGLAGVGTAVLLVAIASPAGAATDVVIPLAPTQVVLFSNPVENSGAVPLDPSADPAAPTPVPVEYTGSLTVDLPAGLDSSAVEADLVFDDDGDGNPEAVYSSTAAPLDPMLLSVTGEGTSSITVTLPADDPTVGDDAVLVLEPLTTTYDPDVFTFVDPVAYDLTLSAPADPLAPAAVTVEPALVALASVPCPLSSTTPCPVAVTAGANLVLDLTADSALRELGLTDLTGVQVAVQSIDDPDADPVLLDVRVSGSTATATVPAGLAAGSYGLVLGQPFASGLSIVVAELAVSAPAGTPAAAPTTAAPSTQAVVANTGLRSNTGVVASAETGSTGSGTVAAGAGLLLLAGAGGVAVARTRRRPAVGTGTGEA
ncbi:hypothetical protein [Geodermatophilus sp. URMC 63]